MYCCRLLFEYGFRRFATPPNSCAAGCVVEDLYIDIGTYTGSESIVIGPSIIEVGRRAILIKHKTIIVIFRHQKNSMSSLKNMRRQGVFLLMGNGITGQTSDVADDRRGS